MNHDYDNPESDDYIPHISYTPFNRDMKSYKEDMMMVISVKDFENLITTIKNLSEKK